MKIKRIPIEPQPEEFQLTLSKREIVYLTRVCMEAEDDWSDDEGKIGDMGIAIHRTLLEHTS